MSAQTKQIGIKIVSTFLFIYKISKYITFIFIKMVLYGEVTAFLRNFWLDKRTLTIGGRITVGLVYR